jgi:hypothetical protein
MAATTVSCGECGNAVLRVDEHGCCEDCYIKLEQVVSKLWRMEEVVQEWRASDLPADLFMAAVEMSVTDAEGPLPNTRFSRELVETSEGAIWSVPESAFDPMDAGPWERGADPNGIRSFRRAYGLSLEVLAEKLSVPIAELALWEGGAIPPEFETDTWHARQVAILLHHPVEDSHDGA